MQRDHGQTLSSSSKWGLLACGDVRVEHSAMPVMYADLWMKEATWYLLEYLG